MRSRISRAARLVNDRQRTWDGSMPERMACAARWAMTVVLPVPTGARTSNGPRPHSTASRCCSLRSSGDTSGAGRMTTQGGPEHEDGEAWTSAGGEFGAGSCMTDLQPPGGCPPPVGGTGHAIFTRAREKDKRGSRLLKTPPPAPSPRRRGGAEPDFLPLSASGRGPGGGVAFGGSEPEARSRSPSCLWSRAMPSRLTLFLCVGPFLVIPASSPAADPPTGFQAEVRVKRPTRLDWEFVA